MEEICTLCGEESTSSSLLVLRLEMYIYTSSGRVWNLSRMNIIEELVFSKILTSCILSCRLDIGVHKRDFTVICIYRGITVIITYIISPYRANSIKIHGIHYKSGAVVRVAVQSDQSETFPFQYAKIKDFYIYKDHKIFTAQKLNVIGSNTHIRGIQVELIEDVLLFRSNDLYCHGVLHLKQQGLDTYLIEKDNRVKPTFFY